MRLYYIRHAQSTNNDLADRTGSDDLRHIDAPLTERGHRQARALGRYLAAEATGVTPPSTDGKDLLGFGITHLYCSLMDRAIATGTYVAEALGLPLHGCERIHESGGIFEQDSAAGTPRGLAGRNRPELAEAYPALVIPESVQSEGWWNRPYEEMSERADRARTVIDTLKERHGRTEDRVAMVSHGGFFNWILAELLGMQKLEGLWLHTNNASISRFDFIGDHIIMQYTNRTEHLPPELIT